MIKINALHVSPMLTYESVAVLLPAYNEAMVVGQTVRSFQAALPGCTVIVCNNASTDNTAEMAQAAGAIVIDEGMPGKGNAVRRLLATVDAEILVMADADTTYDATAAPRMISHLQHEHLDMVTGVRVMMDKTAYRRGHIWGNRLFNRLFGSLFKTQTQDVFSGYRVLTGRFARALPVQATGFEIEAEMSAVAAVLKLSVGEVPVEYYARPIGSKSKLSTYRDGFRILCTYVRLLRHFHPKRFFGFWSALTALASLGWGLPVVLEFFNTGLVPRFPTAILASSLGLISVMILVTGLLLEAIARNRIEQRQLMMLIKKGS